MLYAALALLVLIGILIKLFPAIAKIVLSFDYVAVLFLAYVLLFDSNLNPFVFDGIALELHTVFTILIMLVILAMWWGFQQIKIKDLYIFKILACAISAIVFTVLFVSPNLDVIWTWTIGILLFLITMGLRFKSNDFVEQQGSNDFIQQHNSLISEQSYYPAKEARQEKVERVHQLAKQLEELREEERKHASE